MSDIPKITLNTLIEFIPDENNEIEILYKQLNKDVLQNYLHDKNEYFNGYYYLGGQIKMKPDEEITIDKINEVRQITKKKEIELGGPANSYEAFSINNSKILLNQLEELVKCYSNIISIRNKK